MPEAQNMKQGNPRFNYCDQLIWSAGSTDCREFGFFDLKQDQSRGNNQIPLNRLADPLSLIHYTSKNKPNIDILREEVTLTLIMALDVMRNSVALSVT